MKRGLTFLRSTSMERGVTLIELMIALLIGLIVVAAATTMFVTTLRSNTDAMRMMRLNQELRAAMTLITREIRRSGYWAGDPTAYPTTYLKWPVTNVNITTTVFNYAYDWNQNGVYDAADDEFSFGWDGSAIEKDGVDLTDPNVVNVTTLQFVVSCDCPGGPDDIQIRDIDITIAGRLTQDASVTRTIRDTVRIRNDYIDN